MLSLHTEQLAISSNFFHWYCGYCTIVAWVVSPVMAWPYRRKA